MSTKTRQGLVTVAAIAVLAGCSARAIAGDSCFYKGTMFSQGASSCQSGMEYRCDDGEWSASNTSCKSGNLTLSKGCQYDGISFSTGAASCQSGTQHRCEDGSWHSLGVACSAGDSPVKVVPSGRTCMFDGATVASNSTICRTGSTYVCSDGQWVNLGTLCR